MSDICGYDLYVHKRAPDDANHMPHGKIWIWKMHFDRKLICQEHGIYGMDMLINIIKNGGNVLPCSNDEYDDQSILSYRWGQRIYVRAHQFDVICRYKIE